MIRHLKVRNNAYIARIEVDFNKDRAVLTKSAITTSGETKTLEVMTALEFNAMMHAMFDITKRLLACRRTVITR